jgi:HSP20 family molecular chaperone IbpA
MEIAPGGKLSPHRQLYEEMVMILSGRGSTRVWNGAGKEVSFEWGPGSLFGIPLNANHQHFNGSGVEPARFVAVTNMPPLMNVFEEPEFIRLVAELPGVKPEDVQIAVEGNVLTIKGNKEQVAEEKAEKVHRYERTYGAFERTFTLPTTVAPDKIKATYEHGLLTVLLPKVETAKPHLIKVEVAPPQKALK